MTIAEIQKVLKTSFKNGVYITRPAFMNIEIYMNKEGTTWHIAKDANGKIERVYENELFQNEYQLQDWEIVV